MSNKVALTASMRSNLLSLKGTQKLFDSTQDKLSTGYKVNSAMDNPSSYFTAQSLNSRANDLSTLLDSIGQAISTLEVADQGITTMQDMVEQAKSVANSARDTQNIASSTKTATKFDMDRTRMLGLDKQITGITATDELIIRVGKADELVGTKAASADALASSTFSTTAVTAPTAGAAGSGGSGSLKVGREEFILDFATAPTDNTMKEYTRFAIGDRLKIVDSSDITKAKVEDSNGKTHIINLTGMGLGAGCTALTDATEITCTTADLLTTTISELGSTAQTSSITAGSWTATMNSLGASGADVKTQSYIQFKANQTVGQVLERMEYFIGKDRISIGVEDGVVAIRSKDGSSIEATATAVNDFAKAFGLDEGTTIKMAAPATDTAEALRQKIDGLNDISAEFDEEGHIKITCANGDDIVISGKLADRMGVSGAVTNGTNNRDAYAKQYNNILTQIDELVQDTSYKGINLLNGDNLLVNFNESRTSSIELKGVTFDTQGLGLAGAQKRWVDNASIDKSLEQITQATAKLRAQASEFGQNLSTIQIREDFTQNMINNLQSGADKLTLADMNEEGANMLALQTRQQLGLNSLSLASQAAQGVLRLF